MREGWEIKSLGEVCTFYKKQSFHSGLPYIGLEHIESGTGHFIGSMDTISVKSATFHFTEKHVLFGRLRPYLNKVLLPDFEGHCSTEIFPMEIEANITREYLYYWLMMNETIEAINRTSTGARMPRANMNAVLNFEFPVAPLPEQIRIVAILDEAFEGIATAKANAEKNLQNAREVFESHLNAVFSQRGEGWVEKKLSEICNIKHGFAFDGSEFSNEISAGKPIVITPGNFTENGTLSFSAKNTKRFIGQPSEEFIFNIGDLVIVMTDLSSKMKILGKPAFVEIDNLLHNQRIGRFIFLNDTVDSRFVYYFMLSNSFVSNIKQSATGTMVKHTAPTRILSNVIPFPFERREQSRIVSMLLSLRIETQHLESIYQQKLAALDELKQSLLHQAFNGDL